MRRCNRALEDLGSPKVLFTSPKRDEKEAQRGSRHSHWSLEEPSNELRLKKVAEETKGRQKG